jgi:hypothetical protein
LTDNLELQAQYRYQLVNATEHGFATASGQNAAFSMGDKPVQSLILSIRWSLDSLP